MGPHWNQLVTKGWPVNIDYAALLEKYMRHVMQCESLDFTDRLNEGTHSEVAFEHDEIAELKRISESVAANIWETGAAG
jgi:hypothetical protein